MDKPEVFFDDDEWPNCSAPDSKKWPNNINAMLNDIRKFRFQSSDPKGYRAWLNDKQGSALVKDIKGSAEAGRKKGDT